MSNSKLKGLGWWHIDGTTLHPEQPGKRSSLKGIGIYKIKNINSEFAKREINLGTKYI
ncbi:hypothetical protein CREGCYN_02530 [Synechococcus sp. M16CYN]